VSKPEWGTKRICPSCGTRYYDLHRDPIICPKCGTRTDIFGHGGARREAERLGVPFLGEVPLEMTIRETSDAGLPIVATQPDSPHAAAYRTIAANVRDQLGSGAAAKPGPRIVIES